MKHCSKKGDKRHFDSNDIVFQPLLVLMILPNSYSTNISNLSSFINHKLMLLMINLLWKYIQASCFFYLPLKCQERLTIVGKMIVVTFGDLFSGNKDMSWLAPCGCFG